MGHLGQDSKQGYSMNVNQTCSRLFCAVSAAENLIIVGADVSNAFVEAPPPKQDFYIHLDRAFREWWVKHKKRPPIPNGGVIPILLAMQWASRITLAMGKACRCNITPMWTCADNT